MSWIEKQEADFVIITGDGKRYVLFWKNASKNVEYNTATFEFINRAGSLVDRGTPRGTQYGIEIVFQGEKHLEESTLFEKSASDKRPWNVEHPLYGALRVQPISLTFDNSVENVTRITGMVVETITISQATVPTISRIDKIKVDKLAVDQVVVASFAGTLPSVDAGTSVSLMSNARDAYNAISGKIKDSAWRDAFFNAYNRVNTILNSGFVDGLQTIQAIRDYTTLPYQFSDLLRDRLNMFAAQFDLLSSTVGNLFTRASKKSYEAQAGFSLSSMLLASVTNIGDAYSNAVDAIKTIDFLSGKYNKFLSDLDQMQGDNGGSPDSFIPDSEVVSGIAQLAAYTINTLLDIASQGKQQRVMYLEYDCSIITLATRLYGYNGDDKIFEDLISHSNIGLNELLMLRKGRKITYYI